MIIPLPLFDAAPLQRRDKVHDGGENAVSLGDETIDGIGGQGRGEVDRRVQDLDGGSGVGRAEDSGEPRAGESQHGVVVGVVDVRPTPCPFLRLTNLRTGESSRKHV